MCTAVRSCNKQNEMKHMSYGRKLSGLSNRTGHGCGCDGVSGGVRVSCLLFTSSLQLCVRVHACACVCLILQYKRPYQLWSSPNPSCNGCRESGFFTGRSVKSTTHLQFVPKLGMGGAIPLFLLYAFRAWKGTLLFPVDTACTSF
jgi:hypothetical protein